VIDVKVLRVDPDRVRASQRARGESESLVDDLIKATRRVATRLLSSKSFGPSRRRLASG
jgi:seryl-tRNA synthetase